MMGILALLAASILLWVPATAQAEQAEQAEQAVELTRQACQSNLDDGSCARLRAWDYLEADNRIWAVKVLLEGLATNPDDARTRAWVAWLLMQDGDLYRVRRLLDDAPEPSLPEDRSRLELLGAALSELEDKTERAAESLADLRGAEVLYPEDRALLLALRRDILGDRGEPLSARLQVSGGATSNVIESAPQDVGSGAAGALDTAAPIAALDAVLRFEPWASPVVRPLAELRAKGFTPFTSDALGFAYFSSGVRAGVELGSAHGVRARALYAWELMGLRGDGDSTEPGALEGGLVMEAHRGDLELDLGPGVQLFAGTGRRFYRELRRTRTELDAGAAWVLSLGPGWNLTAVGAGRYHLARHPGWDAFGATGLLRLRAPLPGDHMVKLRGMVLWDRWPEFGLWEPSVERRDDLAVRAQLGPWTRSFGGWRFGLTYNFSTRGSNLDDYDYVDHRGLLEARWQVGFHPGLPSSPQDAPSRMVLPYGLDQAGDEGLDRVQDLLRQEDSARRGSSCAE